MASIPVTTLSPDQTAPVRPAALAEVLAVGTHLLVGQYRVELGTGTWWWSDEVYTMHGWAPGTSSPASTRCVRASTRTTAPASCAPPRRRSVPDARSRARTASSTGTARPGPSS